ncbi:DedA family protein [Paracoccus sp. JM45]|uniref:DedA family protein n=1 Tax=Paracoccus sp. JM45 TaxID=2283626 RepID=UPI000E6C0A66|nr:DedA family protein [Paracoccus sp. JM45]RJE78985.1 DedA family protein [Paracoccus sp. JM45]
MTETILALVPDYGLTLIFLVVSLACLAVPLPASMLVLTAGSFAASGDLSLGWVFVTAFAAFILGDQIAFFIARLAGPKVLAMLGRSPRMAPAIARSENLLQDRGTLAVLLSHTILSPTCPYISYLSGAGGLSHGRFSLAAIPGAAIWTLGYVGLGYVFATQLEQLAQITSQFFGVVLAATVAIGMFMLLRIRWKHESESDAKKHI